MKATKLLLMLLLTLLMGTTLSFSHANAAVAPTDRPADATGNALPAQQAEAIALAHLQANADDLGLSASDLADLRVTDNVALKSSGARVVHFQQTANGIGVFNGVMNVTVTADGAVIFVGNRGVADLVKSVNTATPTISAADAIANAADALSIAYSADSVAQIASVGGAEREVRFSGGDLSLDDITVKLAYQPVADGSVRLAWDLGIYTLSAQNYWSVRVDAATGELLDQMDLVVKENFDKLMEEGIVPVNTHQPQQGTESGMTAPAAGGDGSSYDVYPIPVESPNHTTPVPPADARVVINEPADSTASPFGWHDTNGAAGAEFTVTRGNNVEAYTDTDANNTPDPGSSPDGGAGLDFLFPLDLTQAPSAYRPAAVTNLFVWNNYIHDVTHLYGFDEQAGNFQVNNYGNGGLGNDDVRAEAQDGSGTNNANFFTPADGQRPRMQMYVGTNPTPDVDGDLDNGVIAHEYGHGISNRLTGGPSNVSCLSNSEQMGEGWSDWQALMFTMDSADAGPDARGIGTYLFGQPANGPGIRPAPYSTNFAVNNYDYNDRTSVAIPHGIGFLWATMLWEMNWNLIDRYGFNPDIYDHTALDDGNILAYQLVQDGMAIQPCSPGFEDGRDAILAADVALTGGDNRCEIWDAFAIRGMGFSADQGSSGSVGDGTAAFDMPTFCLGTEVTPNDVAICAGQPAVYSVAVGDPFTQTVTLSGSGNPAPSTLSFAPNSGTPPFTSTMTVANTAGVAAGNYTLEVTATSSSYVNSTTAGLEVFAGSPSAPTLSSPANGATGVSTAPTFQWSALTNISGYQLQVATDAAFTSIVIDVNVDTNSYTHTSALNPQTTYYWRVRGLNPCGNGNYSSVFSFTTANLICVNPNLAIPDNSPAGATFTFNVATSQVITDINVYVDMTHTWVGDVDLQLTHGATSVRFFDRPGVPASTFGCSGDNMDNTFDDEGTINAESQCQNATPAYPAGAALIPNNPLSAFDGQDVTGSWTLLARDGAGGDTGTVHTICLQIPAGGGGGGSPEINVTPTTLDETHNAPPQVTTDTLTIQNTGNADLVWTIDEDNTRPWNSPNPVQPRDTSAPVERLGAAGGATTVAPEAGPIVGDGSFEAGTPNPEWEEFSSNFGTPLCDAVCGTGGGTGPRTGLWWAWFGGTTAAETGILTQTVTIPSGSAELSFWLEIPATATGTNGFLSVRMDGTEVFRAEETTPGYGTYAEVTVDASAYADGGSHELVFFSSTDAGSAVTNFFVDDVAITATAGGTCDAPSDIPWLTLSSTGGTTAGGASSNVSVVYNSATLAAGTYTGTLCIESNDADEPLVQVPVSLEVADGPTAVSLGDLNAAGGNTVPVALFAVGGIMLVAAAGFVLRRK
jgi:subtilisin-like proprotein convertase family protein